MALPDAEFIVLDGRPAGSTAPLMTAAEVAELFGYRRPAVVPPPAPAPTRPADGAGWSQRWARRGGAAVLVASLLTAWAVLSPAVAQHVFGFDTPAVLTGSIDARAALLLAPLVLMAAALISHLWRARSSRWRDDSPTPTAQVPIVPSPSRRRGVLDVVADSRKSATDPWNSSVTDGRR